MRNMHLVPSLVLSLSPFLIPATFAKRAPVTTNNPPGVRYIAAMPNQGALSGSVVASSTSNGTGVDFQVSISGLPSSGEPFSYFIGMNPVSTNGSCSPTDGVLNPYNASTTTCDKDKPAKCAVGDLSGKHGGINDTSFVENYVDLYCSTVDDSPAFVGNRSIVIVASNGTSIACANFTISGSSGSSSSSSGSPGSGGGPGSGSGSSSEAGVMSSLAALVSNAMGAVGSATTSSAAGGARSTDKGVPAAGSASSAQSSALESVVTGALGGTGAASTASSAGGATTSDKGVPAAGGGSATQSSGASATGKNTAAEGTAGFLPFVLLPSNGSSPLNPTGASRVSTDKGTLVPAASSANSSAAVHSPPMSMTNATCAPESTTGEGTMSSAPPASSETPAVVIPAPATTSTISVAPESTVGTMSSSPTPLNSTAVPAVTIPATTLTSTPGVIPGFIPGLDLPASTVTTGVDSTVTTSEPASTVTMTSNSTATVTVVAVVQSPNSTTSSSSPTESPVCGTGMVITLPNGSVETVLVGPTKIPGAVTTIQGGKSGRTKTLPGRTNVIEIPAQSTTVVTLPPSTRSSAPSTPSTSSGTPVPMTTLSNPDTTQPGVSVVTLTILTGPSGAAPSTHSSKPPTGSVVTLTQTTPARTIVSPSSQILSVVQVVTSPATTTSAGVVTTTVPVTYTSPASTWTTVSTRQGLFNSLTSKIFGQPVTRVSSVVNPTTIAGKATSITSLITLVYPNAPSTSSWTQVKMTTVGGSKSSYSITKMKLLPTPSTVKGKTESSMSSKGAIPPPPSSQKTTYTWGDAVRPTMAIGAGVGALGMAVLMM